MGVLVVLTAVTATGNVGTWKNFTSMKDVKGIVRTGSLVWTATSGGLFAWDADRNTFQQFTNADGLQNIDLTALAVDGDGNVWSGTSSGVIHILTPSEVSWRYILDIATTSQTNKKINRITMYGDTVLICTEFGLSIFRRTGFEFGDTFTKFGSLTGNVRVSVQDAAIYGGSVWAAVTDGQNTHRIAVARLSTTNLLPPDAWSLLSVGPPSAVPKSIAVFNGSLIAGTTQGVYVLHGETWVAVPTLETAEVLHLAASASRLAACTAAGDVFTIDQQNVASRFGSTLPYPCTSAALTAADQVMVGTLGGGILTWEGTWKANVPNGPASNQFLSVAVDPNGVVWGASGSANGSGFYRYDGNRWKSFAQADSPLPTDNYYRVSVGCNGSLWASSYGRGLVEIPAGTDSIDRNKVYGQNVGMVGVPNDRTFIVTSNVVCDGRGNTWTSIVNAADKNVLAARTREGVWTTLPAILGNAKISFLMDSPVDKCLAVDALDNLWATVREGAFKGVISLGNRGSLDSTAAFHVTTANGLPSDDIKTIVVDNNNEVWVGTDKGIGIILDPNNPTRDRGVAAYRPLNGLVVNSIAVDALNQKWVGTTEGVILLSPDGTQQLASYTVTNTNGKLIDNDVKSIAFDSRTGTVYFGTLSGLASLTTASPAPKASFDQLVINPNPFVIPESQIVTIDGLVENSSLKIISADGHLVREIRTPGGRIGFWDGRNAAGTYVASGIYIIAASSEDGTRVATAKVAVIRK